MRQSGHQLATKQWNVANGTHLGTKWVTSWWLKGAGPPYAGASCNQYGKSELFWFRCPV